MKNNKVLCIGDSTSLPGNSNSYEDTWYYKLKKEFPELDFISVLRRSLTTKILVTEGGGDKIDNFPMGADCLEFYNPEIIIIQLGIVDCAPRLINQNNLIWKIVKRFPQNFINLYINYLKKFSKRNPKNVLVSEEVFELNLLSYFERCQKNSVKKLHYILIPIPDQVMIDKNPFIVSNIINYNNIIKKFALKYDFINLIEVLDARILKDIYSDGYHPNPNGNEVVFNALCNSFKINNQ
jgi:acyl-CoA thioesterase I